MLATTCRERAKRPGNYEGQIKVAKRILFTLMVVALLLVLTGAAVAYFSDVEASTGNTFGAGTW